MTREDAAIAIVSKMMAQLTPGEEKRLRERFALPPRPEFEDVSVEGIQWGIGLAKLRALYF